MTKRKEILQKQLGVPYAKCKVKEEKKEVPLAVKTSIKISGMESISLTVQDLNKSLDFYKNVLSLKADGNTMEIGKQKVVFEQGESTSKPTKLSLLSSTPMA